MYRVKANGNISNLLELVQPRDYLVRHVLEHNLPAIQCELPPALHRILLLFLGCCQQGCQEGFTGEAAFCGVCATTALCVPLNDIAVSLGLLREQVKCKLPKTLGRCATVR